MSAIHDFTLNAIIMPFTKRNPSIISINRMYQDSLQMQFITTKWLELHPSQNINNYAIKINTAQHDQL